VSMYVAGLSMYDHRSPFDHRCSIRPHRRSYIYIFFIYIYKGAHDLEIEQRFKRKDIAMVQKLKVKMEPWGRAVQLNFFFNGHNVGSLIVEIGSWQMLGTAIHLGADKMQGHFTFEVEGEDEALGIKRGGKQ